MSTTLNSNALKSYHGPARKHAGQIYWGCCAGLWQGTGIVQKAVRSRGYTHQKGCYLPEYLRRAKSQAAYLRFGDKVAGNVLLDFSPVAPHELPEGLQCLQVEPGLFPFFGTCSKACCFERCHGMPGTSHCQEPFRSQVPPIDAVLDFIRLCSSLC